MMNSITTQLQATVKLKDLQLLRQASFINGQWVRGEKVQAVTNPATNQVIGQYPLLEGSQISEAIDQAQSAFEKWRLLLVDERAQLLMRWHDLLLENIEDLSLILVLEQGKTINEARGEIEYGASFVRWFAEEARRATGETIPSHIAGAQLSTVREPIGVAALITPWNFPNAMITRKAAAALAIGCSVIVKPADETPLSALALAELADRAGFPAGVFNVVTGDATMISQVLCRSDKVKALSFTGSTRVGKLLLAQAAQTVKKCSMELGGNAPFIVLPDMDIEQAAQKAVEAKFQTSGQDCLAANRIFVPQSHYSQFLVAFEKSMSELNVGNGLDPASTMGPLISSAAVNKAQQIVEDALNKGARLVAGNQTHVLGDNFYMPTLLADVTLQMQVFREENFCPVAGVISYDSLDQVIAMSNDTEYGLAAYVFGFDVRNLSKLINSLEFGMVSVNSVKMTGHSIPFGGIKQSGLGREGGIHGLDEFSELKYCCVGSLPLAANE